MVTLRVEVRLKKGVADPEGENTLKALRLLGFDQASGVHSIKVFDVELDTEDHGKAQSLGEDMCRRLLANPVIHDYSIQLLQVTM